MNEKLFYLLVIGLSFNCCLNDKIINRSVDKSIYQLEYPFKSLDMKLNEIIDDPEQISILIKILDEIDSSFENETEPWSMKKRSWIANRITSIFDFTTFRELFNRVSRRIDTLKTCLLCKIFARLFKYWIVPSNSFLSAIEIICVKKQIQKESICRSMVNQIRDVFVYIKYNGKLDSDEICGVVIGRNCLIFKTDNVDWTLPIPVRKAFVSRKAKRQLYFDNVTIAHISDIHIDLNYATGMTVNCHEPVCCRQVHGVAQDSSQGAGYWGTLGGCNTPVLTFFNAMEQINATQPFVYYILNTGDFVPHDIWQYNRSTHNTVFDVVEAVNAIYKQTKIYSVLGNHEAIPINSYSPSSESIGYPEITNDWLYQTFAIRWSTWLPRSYVKPFKLDGNYVIKVHPGFRMIQYNSNYCARINPFTMYESIDPGNVLQWLINALLSAEDEGDTVHLIGHIAPDHRECTQSWLNSFVMIIERFQYIIKAQFYGHTHYDEFRVYYSLHDPSIPIGFALIAPALTPYSKNNPAYRLYTMDNNGVILDYQTKYFNLTADAFASRPCWKTLYKASELFQSNEINSQVLDQFLQRLQSNESLFQLYYRYYYTNSVDPNIDPLTDEIKQLILHDHIIKMPMEKPPVPLPFSVSQE